MTGMAKTTFTKTRGGAASTGSSTVNERTTTTTDTEKIAQKETPTTISAKITKLLKLLWKEEMIKKKKKTKTKTETKTTSSGRSGQK